MKHNKKPSFGFARKTIFTLGSVFVFFVILVILFRKFPHVSDLRENLLSKRSYCTFTSTAGFFEQWIIESSNPKQF
jgi:hypothetical protein